MIKKKKINNIITTFVFSIFCLMMTAKPTYASTYYIRALLDEGNFGVICQVVTDKGDSTGPDGTTGYLEKSQGYDFSAISNYGSVHKGGGSASNPGSSLIANIVQVVNDENANPEDIYKELKSNADANAPLVFSFPGIVTGDIKYKAMSSDFDRAQLVAETLGNGLNDALAFIKLHSGSGNISEDGLRHVLAQLARITSQFRNSAVEKQFNAGPEAGNKAFYVGLCTPSKVVRDIDNKQVKIKDVLVPINDLKYADYAYIRTTNKSGNQVYGYFPWRMAKGYASGQPLYDKVSKQYRQQSASQGENQHLTWGQLIIQAGLNADIKGATLVDSSQDTMTLIGQGLGADLTSTITSVRSMLNLIPIQELILNMDSRENDYHQGVMPQNMYDTAKEVYVLVLVVSLLFLSTLIIKMIHQKMLSTTNIIAKTSLMEGVQDILFVGVMLAFFPTIFEILLELNVLIVDTFGFSSEYLRAYGLSSSKVLSTGTIAGFIVSSMFLSIDVYINTTYLVRAIVVSFLFAISPILTVSYCWGPMQKKLYFSYMRELIGNIFMQSFHAITMTFFAGYNRENMSSMEALASSYCFIPVTQLFRQLVIGSQGGFSENLGGKLAGQLTNTAMGLHKSNVAMKQSQEMLELQASNAKNMSWTALGAQGLGIATDVAGNVLQGSIMGAGELNFAGGNKSGGGGNKSGGGKSSVGRAIGSVVAGGALGGLGAVGGGFMTSNTAQKANENLGKMQMEHSMQNIGIGLAQAGAGIGMSSFDAAAGNSAVGAGLSSVQTAAAKYGEGQGYSGTAGQMYAEAKGVDTGTSLGTMAAMSFGRNVGKVHRDIQEQKLENARNQAAQAQKEKTRGLDIKDEKGKIDYSKTAKYMGFGDNIGEKGGINCPIEKVEAHNNNTDSSTIVFNSEKLTQANKDNSIVQLNDVMRDLIDNKKLKGDALYNHPDFKAALEKAHNEFGVSKTVPPTMTKDGKLAVVINKMSNLGIEVDGSGQTYATSQEIMKAKGFENKDENKK